MIHSSAIEFTTVSPRAWRWRRVTTRPHDPDHRRRHPADDHDRRLEPTQPTAFDTPVGRADARKPRRWSW
jgi:hypothetical protein